MEFEEGEMASSSSPIDYQLYRKFWALQDYFRDPRQCYQKDKWRVFHRVRTLTLKTRLEYCLCFTCQQSGVEHFLPSLLMVK